MANLRVVFANGTEVNAAECGIVPHVVAEPMTLADALEVIAGITEEGALARVCVFDDDTLRMEFRDVALDGFQGVFLEEDVTLHLYMHETGERTGATEEDLANVDAFNILFGMEDEEEEE